MEEILEKLEITYKSQINYLCPTTLRTKTELDILRLN